MAEIEILSPAGSMESFRAAINAGADAIYLGGNMFGARAYANNFDAEHLLEAIKLAHIHGRKVYLTVNTLLKNNEIANHLFDFISPLYEAGLDAVIVQDLGVLYFIKNNFPDLDIHASTQMTSNSFLSAKILKEMGVSRVVTSRELSLTEIKKIKEETGVEIESFVHGALCYCYSGQCLMSSMIGGRSGNRGRCAQPCRLLYSANDEKNKHILSPKDICTLDILPDIIEAGVYSLKIEGRMKSPEYTAGVVSIYRKYVDLYLEKGRKNYKVDPKDVEKLMDLFNRGNFTSGYYTINNGPSMMSMDRPNHQGTKAIEVVETLKGKIKVKALNDLNPQDIVDVSKDFTWTNGVNRKKNEVFTINTPNNLKVKNGNVFYRVKNNCLVDEIQNKYINSNIRQNVKIYGEFLLGKRAYVKIQCGNKTFETYGNIVEAAQKSPMDADSIKKQLVKLGNTEFVSQHTDVVCDDNIFISVQEIKELRRILIDGITAELSVKRQKVTGNIEVPFFENEDSDLPYIIKTVVYNKTQLKKVLEFENVSEIYYDISTTAFEEMKNVVEAVHNSGKIINLALPHIFRKNTIELFEKNIEYIKNAKFDGFLIRNLDELSFLVSNNIHGNRIADYNIYNFNNLANIMLKDYGINIYTVSPENNRSEISFMNNSNRELIVYGYIPAMLSAQCVMKNLSSCQKGSKKENVILSLKDRKGEFMPVVNNCKWCYNLIYNADRLNLLGCSKDIGESGLRNVRLDFALCSEKEICEVLNDAVNVFMYNKDSDLSGKFTKGHFYRGVE